VSEVRIEKSLQHLRKRVDQLDRRPAGVSDGLRYAVLACQAAWTLGTVGIAVVHGTRANDIRR
jgi:hypothetical protein